MDTYTTGASKVGIVERSLSLNEADSSQAETQDEVDQLHLEDDRCLVET